MSTPEYAALFDVVLVSFVYKHSLYNYRLSIDCFLMAIFMYTICVAKDHSMCFSWQNSPPCRNEWACFFGHFYQYDHSFLSFLRPAHVQF
jgi:hypothetical protein